MHCPVRLQTTMYGGTARVDEAMAAAVPNCSVRWLDCGHWIQMEKADEVNAILVDFLTGGTSKL
eukprot:m.34243 g.34243  ORF g.34243 m.34243 type:complete len:64 (+) comp12634_c0_seq1:102-293(+)